MPNPGAELPLRKVTLNLYEEDCVILETVCGYGWTADAREAIHQYVLKHAPAEVRRRTLGDLNE